MDDALVEIYRKLRPGELPTVEAARTLFDRLLFDPKRYDLAKVGRHKFNDKLSLATRITGQTAAEDIADLETGEILVEKDNVISEELAIQIQNSGVNSVKIKCGEGSIIVLGNGVVDITNFVDEKVLKDLGIKELVNYRVLKDILDNNSFKSS